MDNDFEILLKEAKKLAVKKELTKYATIGQVGSALLTKNGNIYTGVSMEAKCNLGNCGEHAAIAEMLKNNESEIDKIVAYSAKGQIYAPCGRCRELIRMVNDKNLNTKVMVAENKVCILKDLLPEMYISKKDNKEKCEG